MKHGKLSLVAALVAGFAATFGGSALADAPLPHEPPSLLRTRLLLLRAGRLGAPLRRRSGIHCERAERHSENNQHFLHFGFPLLGVDDLKTVQSTFSAAAEAAKKAR